MDWEDIAYKIKTIIIDQDYTKETSDQTIEKINNVLDTAFGLMPKLEENDLD